MTGFQLRDEEKRGLEIAIGKRMDGRYDGGGGGRILRSLAEGGAKAESFTVRSRSGKLMATPPKRGFFFCWIGDFLRRGGAGVGMWRMRDGIGGGGVVPFPCGAWRGVFGVKRGVMQ